MFKLLKNEITHCKNAFLIYLCSRIKKFMFDTVKQ
jgi:hypothetical protein